MFLCGYAKKGTFPVDGAVYRKYVPYCKKCNKKDSRTVIQNDKLEIVVSFENLVISSTNGFCIRKNYLVKYNFNPTIQLSKLVPNFNVGN